MGGIFPDAYIQDIHHEYLQLRNEMHAYRPPMRLLSLTTNRFELFGWNSASFEVILICSPIASKRNVAAMAREIVRIVKKHENRLFINEMQVF
ncbi:hypothetical protein ACOME3_005165 [Neoechinorhynchus agilis]